MDYFALDMIIADEKKISASFDVDIHNFGFYKSQNTSVIKAGAPVKYPVFLVKWLMKNEQCVHQDKFLQNIEDDLHADAALVSLNGSFIFSNSFLYPDREFIKRIFFDRMAAYSKMIVSSNHHEPIEELMSEEEKKYFHTCRSNYKRFAEFYRNLDE
ncbi:hypothetical protein ENBRE01_1602 [Enteropsectra breve]|nr:hypothetical protein ENBRE01_1602 [Enteropsectra breve]